MPSDRSSISEQTYLKQQFHTGSVEVLHFCSLMTSEHNSMFSKAAASSVQYSCEIWKRDMFSWGISNGILE